MNVYETANFPRALRENTYPGRGILLGVTPDGGASLAVYFIMGRSVNSRNRVFVERDGALFTEPFDPSLVEDPSLIIYAAERNYKNNLVLTNGDQTDTVVVGLKKGKSFKESLESRSFEPDAPNFTPRISGILTFADKDFTYEMSILKSADAEGTACNRYTFSYTALAGLGHFIHTYVGDGTPLPTFQGEPERVEIGDDIDRFTGSLWDALNHDNRISLFVRYTDLATGKEEKRLVNQNV